MYRFALVFLLGQLVAAAPLHEVAHRGDEAATAELIRSGADVNAATRYGVTPISLACSRGHGGIIEVLLEAGANPNEFSSGGETLLHTAARTGTLRGVKALLRHGADPDPREGTREQTPLMWAAAENHAHVIPTLIDAGADPNALSQVVFNGGFTPLSFAVRAGHREAVDVLIDAGADVNMALARGTSMLVLAVINGNYHVALDLLERGADPNAAGEGWTALHQLVWTRRPTRSFANPAAIPTKEVSDFALVRALVAHGANVNARQTGEPVGNKQRNVLDRRGATPFLLAAKDTDVELMRLLLELGADPSLATHGGTTPLLAAAGVGIWSSTENAGSGAEALEAIKLLVESGASVAEVDENGDTALHGAVMRDTQELLLYLIEQGAPVNAVNSKGWTPLTIAQGVFYANLGRRWPEMQKVLLKFGATSDAPPDPLR